MKFLKIITLSLVLLLGLSLTPGLAQESTSVQEITFEATAEGVVNAPEEVESGLTTVTFDNQGSQPYIAAFAKMNPDVTREQIEEAGTDSIEAVLPLLQLLGGRMTMPQSTTQATYDLEPGSYVATNLASPSPQFNFIEVTVSDNTAASLPEADQTIELHDFAYTAPLEVSAGEQTWLIENHGEQPHEMLVSRIDENMTISEFQSFIIEEMSKPENPAPASFNPTDVSWTPMHPGQKAWLTVELEPGTYALQCYLPDFAGDGQAHALHGMVQLITVSE